MDFPAESLSLSASSPGSRCSGPQAVGWAEVDQMCFHSGSQRNDVTSTWERSSHDRSLEFKREAQLSKPTSLISHWPNKSPGRDQGKGVGNAFFPRVPSPACGFSSYVKEVRNCDKSVKHRCGSVYFYLATLLL